MGSARGARPGLCHDPPFMSGSRSESSGGFAKAQHIVQSCTWAVACPKSRLGLVTVDLLVCASPISWDSVFVGIMGIGLKPQEVRP